MTDHGGGDRPFRFALQLTMASSGAEWLDAGRSAQAQGWDVVSMPDHLDTQLAPLVGLAALGAVTSTVRLGTFVLALGWRRLGMLAKEVATLDFVTGGRLEIGLGGGWNAAEFAALGLDFPPASERIALVERVVPVLRALWRGETVEDPVDGGRSLTCVPRPAQPGGPPIVLGAGGPKALRTAGSLADIVSLIPSNAGRTQAWTLPEGLDFASVARQVDLACEAAAGRAQPPSFNVRLLGVTPGADPLDAARRIAAERGASHPEELVDSPYLLLGRPQDMAEQLERVRAELGVSYFTVSLMHAGDMAEAMEIVRSRG